jgi:hypothetical protein
LRPCSTDQSHSPAGLWPYPLGRIFSAPKPTEIHWNVMPLRYPLGGCRPSKTTNHALLPKVNCSDHFGNETPLSGAAATVTKGFLSPSTYPKALGVPEPVATSYPPQGLSGQKPNCFGSYLCPLRQNPPPRVELNVDSKFGYRYREEAPN